MQRKQLFDERILEPYHEIGAFMNEIDNKILEIVQNHEKDFLVAFRSIMGQVHEEMKKLREISDEEALLAKRNNALNDLKGALTWFQDEAVKLSEACSDIQEKYDIHKQKIHALETENAHLEKLVKNYTEDNEELKKEFFARNNKSLEPSQSPDEVISKVYEGEHLREIMKSFEINDNEFVEAIERFISERDEYAERAIEYKLNNRMKKLKKLKIAIENKNRIPLEEGTFESIFTESVKSVMEDAANRRSKQTVGKYQYLDKSGKFIITAADKRKILEEFITKPQIYTLLSQKLFPDDFPKAKKNQDGVELEQGLSVKSFENISGSSLYSQNHNLFKDLV